MWTSKGGKLSQECETNMVWLDLEDMKGGKEGFVQEGVREGVKVLGGRLVVHYRKIFFTPKRASASLDPSC